MGPEFRAILPCPPALFLEAFLGDRHFQSILWLADLNVFRSIKDREMLANNVFLPIPANSLRSEVPTHDGTFCVEHENRVVLHALHQQAKPFLTDAEFLTIAKEFDEDTDLGHQQLVLERFEYKIHCAC